MKLSNAFASSALFSALGDPAAWNREATVASRAMVNVRDNAHWRRVLTKVEYDVLRRKHTEPAGSGEYDKAFPAVGHFACRACGQPLYSTASKFAAGCGWPAFSRCYVGALRCEPDLEQFEACGGRVEILCSGCDGHLGHVFFEGERNKDERHCVNSLSIRHVSDAPGDAAVLENAALAAEQSIRKERDEAMDRAMRILMGLESPMPSAHDE